MAIFKILQLSVNAFQVRTKVEKQQHYKKLDRSDILPFNIVEC